MNEIANTEVVEYGEVRQRVKDLRSKVEEDNWELSAAIHVVYANSYYTAWGFQSFREYVEQELDFQMRKAQYLVAIQDWFGKMKPSVQKWIREMGWTKAKELVGVITEENAAEWKKKLAGKSYKELMSVLKSDESGGDEGDTGESGSGTDDDERPTMKRFSLFPAQAENVENALAKAKEMAKSEKDGHCLDMICVDFLATNGSIGELDDYLKKIEKITGIKLVACHDDGTVVFGMDTLDKLAE